MHNALPNCVSFPSVTLCSGCNFYYKVLNGSCQLYNYLIQGLLHCSSPSDCLVSNLVLYISNGTCIPCCLNFQQCMDSFFASNVVVGIMKMVRAIFFQHS